MIGLLCILLTLSTTQQFNMNTFELSDGIIYSSFQDAHIHTSTKTLSYLVNLYQIEYLNRHKDAIASKCKNNIKLAHNLEKQLIKLHPFQNISNDREKIESNANEITLSQSKNLDAFILQLGVDNNESKNCKIIQNIIDEVTQINSKIVNLISGNKYAILDFLSLDDLRIDIKAFFRKFNEKNLMVSFNFEKPFRTAFFDEVEQFYTVNKETLHFGFHIPFYTKAHLVKINPRPIVLNGTLCIYDTDILYATTNTSELMLFSNDSYSTNCKWNKFERSVFCKHPTKARKCDETYLLHRPLTFDAECFKILPTRNMIVRKNYDIYFTLFFPLQISILCDSNTFNLQLNTSTKISDLVDCSVNTPFYTFNASTNGDYEIIISPQVRYMVNNDKQIVLIYFLIYLTILMVISITANSIYSYHKRKSLKDLYSPNPHIFIAESGELSAALAREAVIIHDTFV